MAMANMKSSLLELEHPPACAAGLPTEVDQIKAELIEAAREISPQECGCIVIETMWRELTESLGRIQKRVPAILANGNLPSEKDCQDALVNEFNRIRDAASRCSSAEELTDSSIRKRFDAKLSMVTDANFLNELRFIPAFHGKRLMRRLRNRLQSGFGFSPNQKLFQRELTNSLESLVLENPESDVANDFRDLANIVCALIPG